MFSKRFIKICPVVYEIFCWKTYKLMLTCCLLAVDDHNNSVKVGDVHWIGWTFLQDWVWIVGFHVVTLGLSKCLNARAVCGFISKRHPALWTVSVITQAGLTKRPLNSVFVPTSLIVLQPGTHEVTTWREKSLHITDGACGRIWLREQQKANGTLMRKTPLIKNEEEALRIDYQCLLHFRYSTEAFGRGSLFWMHVAQKQRAALYGVMSSALKENDQALFVWCSWRRKSKHLFRLGGIITYPAAGVCFPQCETLCQLVLLCVFV